MWRAEELVGYLAEGLRGAEQALREEHAVRGLDAMEELELHPILGAALAGAGYGVVREQPYPGEVEARAKRSARDRCDLVVLPEAGVPLLDPVAELKAVDRATGTLFEAMAEEIVPAGRVFGPDEGFWLEVKAVHQVGYVEGVPRPNAGYAGELLKGPAKDVVKLASEPYISFGGALVLLFAQDERVVRHDLAVAAAQWLDQDLPVGEPVIECVPIEDRVGNAVCGVSLVRVRL